MGRFHDEPCDECEARRVHFENCNRAHGVAATRTAERAAWDAYQAGRGLPLEKWLALEKAWRAAVEASREAFVAAANESRAGVVF
jgi:hypothetical protein